MSKAEKNIPIDENRSERRSALVDRAIRAMRGLDSSQDHMPLSERERLALLLEEMGEAQQAIGKVLRHGYANYHPDDKNGPDNRERLQSELGDVYCAITMLCDAGDLNMDDVIRRAAEKRVKVRRWLWYQEDENARLLSILRRIYASTPHSMCSDAEAWALLEREALKDD